MTALLFPFIGIKETWTSLEGEKTAPVYAVVGETFHFLWFILMICQVSMPGSYVIAWIFFFFFIALLAMTRWTMRGKYNIWGSFPEVGSQ
jgi:protein-S-isoprenylcysteine O-methyltransferase Ste14